MTTYTDLLNKLEESKNFKGNIRFTDVKLYFSEARIYVGGLLDGKGNSRPCSKNLLNIYTPTSKGYMSSSWKKTDFYKLGTTELTEELFNELTPFIQNERANHFVRNTGVSVASVMANHINNKVDYASNRMKQ
tara:strand:- start:545 stop:943 length:399 start_codon:yes stop_codon:yes gene_type:complete